MSPPAALNFAEHLFALNRGRASKTAYVDDHGTLSYGALEERSRRFAAALLASGLRSGERVLLVQLDTADWPVAFLGALFAGVVPVAVNTLLTADDYAYMLEHCGARGVLASGTLLPVLSQAMARLSDAAALPLIVSHPVAELPEGARSMDSVIAEQAPLSAPAATAAQDPAFWLYSSGSTGRPKGTVHTHASPWWTAELFGKPVLGLSEGDVCFSAAKLYFAYGLGNALTFPLSVGATVMLMAERPTPEATFRRWTGVSAAMAEGEGAVTVRPSVFFGAPTGFAGMLASAGLPAREAVGLRMCSSAGEALPGELAQRFKAHYGCDIIDGIGSTEMLHV
ncbi:MAG: benzoate-CoA ligase family protein, partial [Comamonadaceae bacterium]